jgi:hypothetical protein
MPRTATAPDKPSPQAKYGLELASHKTKIRNQKDEISKPTRSIKVQKDERQAEKQDHDAQVARLEGIVQYLTRTAEPHQECEETPQMPLVEPLKLIGSAVSRASAPTKRKKSKSKI